MAVHIKENWLDSCLDEMILPGSPWYDVKNIVSRYFVDRIRIEGLNNEQLAKLRYFLGTKFLTEFNVSGLNDKVTFGKAIRPKSGDKDVENKFKEIILKAIKDARCEYKTDLSDSPESFKNLITLINNIIESTVASYIASLRHSNLKSFKNNTLIADISQICDSETELLGEALVSILQKEPNRIKNILGTLSGKILPISLRTVVYRLLLLKHFKEKYTKNNMDNIKMNKGNQNTSQKFLREMFAKTIKKGMEKHHLKKATNSPIRQLIQSTVIDKYENSLGLKPYSCNVEIQKESCKVLNIIFTNTNMFEPFYLFWLIPLQVAVNKDRYAPEHVYELALWLDTSIKFVFPISIKNINSIAVNIWETLLNMNFMKDVLKVFDLLEIPCSLQAVYKILKSKNNDYSSKNEDHLSFSNQSLSSYKSDASSTTEYNDFSSNTNGHPILCLRKWILQLFVGVTNLQVTMFLFDQLFMDNFSSECVEKCCIVLLESMESQLVTCRTCEDVCLTLIEKLHVVKIWNVHHIWNREK